MSATASHRSDVCPIAAGDATQIVRACADPLGVFDPAGRLQICNVPWLDTLGDTTHEHLEQMMNWRMHGEDLRYWLALWRAALRSGMSYVVEHRMAPKKHEPYRWYVQYGIPLQGPGSDITRWAIRFAAPDLPTRHVRALRAACSRRLCSAKS